MIVMFELLFGYIGGKREAASLKCSILTVLLMKNCTLITNSAGITPKHTEFNAWAVYF